MRKRRPTAIKNDIYTAQMLFDNFWVIEEGGVRCFLVAGTRDAMLIDTGFGKGNLKELTRVLTSLPVYVVHTHSDGDHTGCSEQFGSGFMHPLEIEHNLRNERGLTPPPTFLPVQEGHIFNLGKFRFEVIHIPGHTPGSIALLEHKHKLLISGDSVQSGPTFMFGRGRNLDNYLASMKKLAQMVPSDYIIFPSHGELPVAWSIITEMIEAVDLIQAGELVGTNPDRPLPCKLYTWRNVKLLY